MRETQRERRRKERGGDAGLGRIIKEKERKGRKGNREGKKKSKGKKQRKEEKQRKEGGGRPTVAWPVVAGGGRSWPELAGVGGQGPKREG